MGIIFRPHRGNLHDSMAEAKEFNSVWAMKRYIVKEWNSGWRGKGKLFGIFDVVIDHKSMTNDERIGWKDSKYVCVKRMGEKKCEVPQCIGMCATEY